MPPRVSSPLITAAAAPLFGARPVARQLFARVAHLPRRRVGHAVTPLCGYFVEHNEVVVVPVENAGQGHLSEALGRDGGRGRLYAFYPGYVGDCFQRNALRRCLAQRLQIFGIGLAPHGRCDHGETGRPALPAVALLNMMEPSRHLHRDYIIADWAC